MSLGRSQPFFGSTLPVSLPIPLCRGLFSPSVLPLHSAFRVIYPFCWFASTTNLYCFPFSGRPSLCPRASVWVIVDPSPSTYLDPSTGSAGFWGTVPLYSLGTRVSISHEASFLRVLHSCTKAQIGLETSRGAHDALQIHFYVTP